MVVSSEEMEIVMKKSNIAALLPILVFLILYLGTGVLFEYVLKIPMGFYNIPIVVPFMIAIFVACMQNRKASFDEKLQIMANGMADKNIITMLLIFLTAGVFVGVVGRSSAESVAYFMLSVIPGEYAVAVLFAVACFVSTAMGTSVGTITLITPIAVAVSEASGFDMALCVASVMGGAMFGDNLSFISDTTIAACNGQGCKMKDKFRENFFIALPAAIGALIIILVLSFRTDIAGGVRHNYNLVQIIPYVLVMAGGIAGFNVFAVLITGILSGICIMLITGHMGIADIVAGIGSGVSGMFETCMVAVLVAAMCALIRDNGGFEALLGGIRKMFKGNKGGQLGIGLLVGAMDIATANNTVAIVMANPIALEICETFLNHDDELLVCSPTYMLYYKLPFRFGAKLAEAHSSDGVSTDLDALYNAITDKTKLVFICNPNNPTGTLVDNRKLDEFVEKLPPHVICVIDEAYYDWITEEHYESALRFVNDRNNVIVLRTFSKIYGMAGLRVGYSVANKDITACLGCIRE